MEPITWDKIEEEKISKEAKVGSKNLLIDVYLNNCDIFECGSYKTDNGNVIDLDKNKQAMLDGTKVYSQQFNVDDVLEITDKLETSVVNQDCIARAKELRSQGLNPAVLNLADAYTACGLLSRGSGAQEESICRITTLSQSLFQLYSKKDSNAVNVDFQGKDKVAYPIDMNFGGIYSPNVTVFRDPQDLYSLLDEPWEVSIISVPALNFKHKVDRTGKAVMDHVKNDEGNYITVEIKYKKTERQKINGKLQDVEVEKIYHDYKKDEKGNYVMEYLGLSKHSNIDLMLPGGGFTSEGKSVMLNKIRTIYRIALQNGHDSLVLGAFGCGVFMLKPFFVSKYFKEVLSEPEFKNKFKHISFAILEKPDPKKKIGIGILGPYAAFYKNFGSRQQMAEMLGLGR